MWQANAAGRYAHKIDRWDAPLDPNFTGAGRTLTDTDGWYKFITVQPGAYPWRNHDNAWRPAHIHFSLFGQAFATRLVTQMYFPGDRCLPWIRSSIRCRTSGPVAGWSQPLIFPDEAGMGARIPFRYRPARAPKRRWKPSMSSVTPFQTVGPYWSIGLRVGLEPLAADHAGARVRVRGRLIDGAGAGIPDGILEWWHPGLPGVQRSTTEDAGSFLIETIRAPYIAVRVLGRGIQTQYLTRLYFADDPDTVSDPVLKLVPEHRRHTLLAQPTAAGEYSFNVVVQGENETVFFDI